MQSGQHCLSRATGLLRAVAHDQHLVGHAQHTGAVRHHNKGRAQLFQGRDGMGQGRVLGADAALAQNMVDGIASFDQVLSKMQKDAALSAKSSSPVKPKTSRLAQARTELGIL